MPIAERLRSLNEVDDGPQLYYYLTSRFGLELYEGSLRWCVDSKKLLKEGFEKKS